MSDVEMQAHLVWKDDREKADGSSRRRKLGIAEWILLLAGLVAVDIFVWSNTSLVLSQAYQDWAFDESLRGLTPAVPGFVHDEISSLFGTRSTPENPPENSDVPRKFEAAPNDRPPLPDMLLGRLRIPRLHLAGMVREGAGSGTLRTAIGHIPGTALPGKMGNIGLAGHRDTFFRALRNIEKDDTIDFETEGGTYRYAVESTKIVSPRDVSVLKAAGGRTLTLVTCYPFYYVGSAPKRFIVRAVQVGPGTSPEQPSMRPSAAEQRPAAPG